MFEWGNSVFDLARMLAKRVHGSQPLWSTWKGVGECALGANGQVLRNLGVQMARIEASRLAGG